MKRNKLNKPNEPQSPNLPISQSPLRYAIIGDPDDPKTWKLRHHTADMAVDWVIMPYIVALLAGTDGTPFPAPPETIVETARHLAEHYQEAKRPVPDALAVLI
jgi:hypothetical protein